MILHDQQYPVINFKKGLLPLIILSVLKAKDMYGYQLVQEIGRRSKGSIITQEGSLYPVMYRLEEAGFVSEHIESYGRMKRCYYHLEPLGEEFCQQLTTEYDLVTAGMQLILGREGKPT